MNIQYFYKYRAVNGRLERILTYSELYFASPSEFNDPFDCKIPVLYRGSDDDFKNFYWAKLKERYPSYSVEKLNQMADEILRTSKHRDKDFLKKIETETAQGAFSRTGVLCLSEINNDILMWSHYADGHRGICLEFNASTLQAVFASAFRIKYQKEYPILNRFTSSDNEELLDTALLTKSDHWDYEKEWRIIERRGSGWYKFPEQLLSGVILGCLIRPDDKIRVMDWLRKRKFPVKLYEASIKEYEFGIELREITTKLII